MPYYYVYSFVRRLSRSAGKDDFREWRAQLVLLWIEGQIVLCSLALVWRGAIGSLGPWIAAIIVILPLVEVNRRLLGNREAVRHYLSLFSKWPVAKRRLADGGVVLLMIASFLAPIALLSGS